MNFQENAQNPASGSHREYSSRMLDGADRAPSRAMLHAVGFKPDDFQKSQIGIASTWSMVTPCNMHINKLADHAASGVDDNGGKAVIFNTITISDGISMGTEGMKYSLVSREVIADSIETVAGCEGFDGVVAIGGCDKNMPGCLIALGRLNRPSVFVYGGTIMPGCHKGRDVDVVSVFEAVGAHANNRIDDEELAQIESCAIPGPGSCGGMYTANTMACAIEALGMSLPNSSAQAAISSDKDDDCRRAGAAVLELIKHNIRPRDIMTRQAFENAITVVIALGGTAVVTSVLAFSCGLQLFFGVRSSKPGVGSGKAILAGIVLEVALWSVNAWLQSLRHPWVQSHEPALWLVFWTVLIAFHIGIARLGWHLALGSLRLLRTGASGTSGKVAG